MKTLLKNGYVINVFMLEIEQCDVLFEEDIILGVGAYDEGDADAVVDVSGKYLCPGFIDGHIHIESTMLTPAELARMCMPHGTTAIVADPHEIANVCGTDGIAYMLEASEGLPLHVYFNLPSCVPATPFDESGATLSAEDLCPFYASPRVLGLAEMMNYPGVLAGDAAVLRKLADAKAQKRPVDGHAPFLSGKALDAYVAAGIGSDHECSTLEEALEKLRKGQYIMIREGTAARNLDALLPLFDPPYFHRCLLVTDDRHPADLAADGHIDHIIRRAVAKGKSAVTAICMATRQAAEYFGLRSVGAIAPGYRADILVLDDLDTVAVADVYSSGKKVVEGGKMKPFDAPKVSDALEHTVRNSFHTEPLTPERFCLKDEGALCRAIGVIGGELITEEKILPIHLEVHNGIDTERDILKLAVIERHKNTGHIGLGFVTGIGLKRGAIASSVSHDAHNLIVVGTNEEDMALAANCICAVGGNVVVADGEVVAQMPLPIAGLMTDRTGDEIAAANERVRLAAHALGAAEQVEPFMNMAFLSLPVIPSLKMTTTGLVDVNRQEKVSLFVTPKA